MPTLVEGFTPRLESAHGISQALIPGATVAITPATTTRAAPGLPDWHASCGKTQLAAHVAETLWLAGEIELLAWVSATTRASVVSGLAAAAVAAIGVDQAGDAESLAGRFIDWLAQTSRPWLVVLDGMVSPQDVDGLWPGGSSGRTLITTSDPALRPGWDDVLSFPVAGFSRREALSYLHGRLTQDRGQRTGAIDLVDQLGGEPLALVQASGAVQPLLTLAATLDGTAIPVTVLTGAAARDYAGGAARGLASEQEAWHGVVSLEQGGLLIIDEAVTPPIARMSAAVQAAIRSATSDDMLAQACMAAADALLEAWPADDLPPWLATSMRSSAMSVIELAGNVLWNGSCYRLLYRVGQSLESAHLTRLAAAHWNGVAAASEQVLGLGHPDALAASDHLATAFLATGRAAEALPWFRSVLADRRSLLGPEHVGTISAEIGLGRALTATGQADEAMAVLDQAVSDAVTALGADHRDALSAQDALAQACCEAGRLAESEYKKILADRERTMGRDHPDTIVARARLAAGHHTAGRIATALRLYEEARADSERVRGADHPATLALLVNLAHAYYSAGRIGDAATLLRDSVERCDRVLPPGDPLAKTARESLANIAGE